LLYKGIDYSNAGWLRCRSERNILTSNETKRMETHSMGVKLLMILMSLRNTTIP